MTYNCLKSERCITAARFLFKSKLQMIRIELFLKYCHHYHFKQLTDDRTQRYASVIILTHKLTSINILLCMWLTLTDLQILGYELYQNAFGGQAFPQTP